ncbi:hypothetical protein TorRG33x02_091310 [Trema orientale]|uniref:Uncharacterized protein n=1 Tax=Trema orientale TaxID=63057 RepID=A0A2P5FAW5_TREOI|nr:hypothetical protein TorRG33x02_091310 [Trema orientale]
MWNWFKGRHGIRDGTCNVDKSDPKTTRGSGILIASRIILLKVPVEEVFGRRSHAICLGRFRPFHIAIPRRNQDLVGCIRGLRRLWLAVLWTFWGGFGCSVHYGS